MISIRGPTDLSQIADREIRSLIALRMGQLGNGEPYDPQAHGEMIVVEHGDTLASLEGESGCPIASNPFDDCRFPDPDFAPVCEYLEEHSHCYELLFLFSDDGAGINFFVPKSSGIDADLLELCARYRVRRASAID